MGWIICSSAGFHNSFAFAGISHRNNHVHALSLKLWQTKCDCFRAEITCEDHAIPSAWIRFFVFFLRALVSNGINTHTQTHNIICTHTDAIETNTLERRMHLSGYYFPVDQTNVTAIHRPWVRMPEFLLHNSNSLLDEPSSIWSKMVAFLPWKWKPNFEMNRTFNSCCALCFHRFIIIFVCFESGSL